LPEEPKISSKYFTKKKTHVLSRYKKIKSTEQHDILKDCIFQDIRACTPLEVNRHFGGNSHLHIRSEELAKQETSVKKAYSWLHGVTSHSIYPTLLKNLKSYI
jgi:hypothetical protein